MYRDRARLLLLLREGASERARAWMRARPAQILLEKQRLTRVPVPGLRACGGCRAARGGK